MTKKKSKQTPIPHRRNALHQGLPGLEFPNIKPEDLIALTPEQKSEKFLTKYMQIVDPIIRYSEYFDSTAKEISVIYKQIKVGYINLVVTEKWTEKKYVAVINRIFEQKSEINTFILDRIGFMYDNGVLDQQENNRNSVRRVNR